MDSSSYDSVINGVAGGGGGGGHTATSSAATHGNLSFGSVGADWVPLAVVAGFLLTVLFGFALLLRITTNGR